MSKEKGITYVGMDVHKSGINVSIILPGSKNVDEHWQISNERRSIERMIRKVKRLGSDDISCCYEAGPSGYALQRHLMGMEVKCAVIAPSLIPCKPGERIKTDSRDSKKLAELFKADLLTEVHPPTPEQEAARDVTRAREDAKKDLLSARHRLSKMLLRHGYIYRDGNNWTLKHRSWLKRLRFGHTEGRSVFDNYLLAIEQIEERVKNLEQCVDELAQSPEYAERVGWLRCLRGVDTLTAMIILSELHDPRRFSTPRELMSYLGLTPSEHSSGTRRRQGGITKTGNSHVRRALVESAWNYRHPASVSAYMARRRKGQPATVIAIADRAQVRLHKRYFKLKEGYQKHHNVATVAVARELVGFIWAILHHEHIA